MKNKNFYKVATLLTLSLISIHAWSAGPKFSITPTVPGSNSYQVNKGDIIRISYLVKNNLTNTKTITIKPIKGVEQLTRGSGVCTKLYKLRASKSCTLKLQIDTNLLKVGTTVNEGPEVCIGPKKLSCSKPSPTNLLQIDVLAAPNALLKISSKNVVTATSTIAGINANRTLRISNMGPSTATGLQYRFSPALPTGTTLTGQCNTINAGGSCTLTISPGANPNTTRTISPTPSTLFITGNNTSNLITDITVLTYGNLYQGGYVYNINASTPANTNVSGNVVETSNLLNGAALPWSPSSNANFSTNLSNGQQNTQTMVRAFKKGNYAAYACTQLNVDEAGTVCPVEDTTCFKNWYLPAICEINSLNTYAANCTPYPNSFLNNLNNKVTFSANAYWSSTGWVSTSNPNGDSSFAWVINLYSYENETIPFGVYPQPYWYFPVRCVHAIT